MDICWSRCHNLTPFYLFNCEHYLFIVFLSLTAVSERSISSFKCSFNCKVLNTKRLTSFSTSIQTTNLVFKTSTQIIQWISLFVKDASSKKSVIVLYSIFLRVIIYSRKGNIDERRIKINWRYYWFLFH